MKHLSAIYLEIPKGYRHYGSPAFDSIGFGFNIWCVLALTHEGFEIYDIGRDINRVRFRKPTSPFYAGELAGNFPANYPRMTYPRGDTALGFWGLHMSNHSTFENLVRQCFDSLLENGGYEVLRIKDAYFVFNRKNAYSFAIRWDDFTDQVSCFASGFPPPESSDADALEASLFASAGPIEWVGSLSDSVVVKTALAKFLDNQLRDWQDRIFGISLRDRVQIPFGFMKADLGFDLKQEHTFVRDIEQVTYRKGPWALRIERDYIDRLITFSIAWVPSGGDLEGHGVNLQLVLKQIDPGLKDARANDMTTPSQIDVFQKNASLIKTHAARIFDPKADAYKRARKERDILLKAWQ